MQMLASNRKHAGKGVAGCWVFNRARDGPAFDSEIHAPLSDDWRPQASATDKKEHQIQTIVRGA